MTKRTTLLLQGFRTKQPRNPIVEKHQILNRRDAVISTQRISSFEVCDPLERVSGRESERERERPARVHPSLSKSGDGSKIAPDGPAAHLSRLFRPAGRRADYPLRVRRPTGHLCVHRLPRHFRISVRLPKTCGAADPACRGAAGLMSHLPLALWSPVTLCSNSPRWAQQ